MLTNHTVEVATNLGKALGTEGLTVGVKPGTLLAELSSAITNKVNIAGCINDLTQATEEDTWIVKDLLQAGSEGDCSDGDKHLSPLADDKQYVLSEHDALMDNYIVEISNLAAGYMSFAHATVNSKVTELADAIRAQADRYKPREAEDFFNVTFYKLDDIFHSPFVAEEINEDEVSSKWEYQPLNLAELEDLELSELNVFETGHEFTDTAIKAYLATVESPKSLILNYQYTPVEAVDAIECSFVNFLFYRNMAINPRVNTGDSLSVLKEKALENSRYFAHELYQALKLYNSMVKTGRLVATSNIHAFSYISEKTYSVKVINENFEKAVEEGCNIETLFGMLSSSDKLASITVKELVEGKESYFASWTRIRSLYLSHLNDNMVETFKFIVRNELDNSLLEDRITDAEKEVISSKPDFIKETIEQANAYIDGIVRTDMEDVDKIALQIVAGIRFRFSNAYTILKRMDDIMRMDEQIEGQEAAVLSLIDYMIDYVTCQMTCTVA